MADIDIKLDTSEAQRALSDMQKQIPFAQASALNDLAFQIMRGENDAFSKIFEHPRPFTLRATQVEKKATKSDLTAVVSLRPAQERYLQPYETGGEHATNGNQGNLFVPVDIKRDPYGQIPRATLKRVMALLSARTDVYIDKARGLVWQRLPEPKRKRRGKAGSGQGAEKHRRRLLLRFAPNRPVNKRLGFAERGMEIVATRGGQALADAIQRAVRTAR
ncbi:hypothetical protein [Acetobacter oryzifermentans]|uniref:Phage protein n=1 Tax=Acetobacter oryzifermentans TaxID=1633874 RepID=A0ABN4NQL2_9PROT|nr:hypothetical protein [Acetobacter oryzifermentans]ANA14180.1 hypothetical protein WG31_09335 [Acetobacter oryzifermentans]